MSWICKTAVMLLAIVTWALCCLAEQVSSEMAARAVNTLVSEDEQLECPLTGTVSSVRLCTATNGAAFYVAKLSGGGFVVTSADTEIDPVIVISTEPDLVEDPQNPLWSLLVGDMAARQEALSAKNKGGMRLMAKAAQDGEAGSSPAARWARLTEQEGGALRSVSGLATFGALAASPGKSKISDVRVSPLLKTKWGQSYVAGKPCFNYYTPGHYVCGCTATASAQILRYHKFPKESVRPHTFGCYVSGYQWGLKQIGGVYDWNNMPYVPNGKTTTAQRKAIGKLTYDVGVAVNNYYSMNNTDGDMALFVDLCHEWGYAHATLYNDDTNSNWIFTRANLYSVLIPNLNAKLPVGVGLRGSRGGGHYVVADGYGYLDNLFSVHLNFGWNGSSDAWYVLPGTISQDGHKYVGVVDMSANIYPHGPERGGIVSGRVLSASTKKPISGIIVTATNSVGKVLCAKTDAKGIYSFILPECGDAEYWPEDDCVDDEYDDYVYDGYDDYVDDEYDDYGDEWYLDHDERNHLVMSEIASRPNDYDEMDDDEGADHGKWVISIDNASPATRSMYVWDAKNYYDQDFSVRIYTVKFNPNGGSGGVVSRQCNVVGALPTTRRTGYTFEGWFTAPNGGEPVAESTLPTGNVTYYAHWRANTYTVEFDSNGGTGSMASNTLTYDVAQALPLNAFEKDGASLRGWSLSPRRLVSFVDGETVMNLASAQDAVVRLYAFWDDDVVAADMGEYFKATLSELGYDVPTDGKTAYSVVAKGLPSGLKLKYNAAVKDKRGRVTKPAKVEWWVEGVPAAALDFFTNPPYFVITVNGVTTTEPLPLEVVAQDVVELDDLALGQSLNKQYYLPGVGSGWSVSGLPTGLSFATKKVTKKSGSKTVTVAEAYAVYGKTTKAGLFTITAKKKVGAYYETMKYRVLVRPKAVDSTVFGEMLTNITTMAYQKVDWDLTGDGGALGDRALPVVSNVVKVAGLPGGVTFAAKDTYAYSNPKKKTGRYLKQSGQTIIGTPTKPGTYVVTFTKNVTTGTGKKKKTVAKTAQILWKVVANDAELSLGFNNTGGVIESGVVGLRYGDLMAFDATDGATVTASGLPEGIKLAKLDAGDGGALGDRALPGFATYGFTGFTAKAGTYLVTVKATIKGKSVTQRVALKVDALPAWAKGTFNGIVLGIGNGEQGTGNGEQGTVATNGLATITVSSAGKISGKFYEGGTNWTFSATSYTARPEASPHLGDEFICSNLVAKYAYKVKEKVKGKVTTVTKYVSRMFVLRVGTFDGCEGGVAAMEELRLVEDNSPYQDGEGTRIEAWQNLWGRADYKTLGKKLFYTSAKKPYKTFSVNGATDGGAAIGLTEAETLSLKVTPAGAVTATMSFDTGKTKKDAKTKKIVNVIYKATCQTVVIPLTAADADPFVGQAFLYFAPSSANGFEGYTGAVPLPF